jgi:hypothetical protein
MAAPRPASLHLAEIAQSGASTHAGAAGLARAAPRQALSRIGAAPRTWREPSGPPPVTGAAETLAGTRPERRNGRCGTEAAAAGRLLRCFWALQPHLAQASRIGARPHSMARHTHRIAWPPALARRVHPGRTAAVKRLASCAASWRHRPIAALTHAQAHAADLAAANSAQKLAASHAPRRSCRAECKVHARGCANFGDMAASRLASSPAAAGCLRLAPTDTGLPHLCAQGAAAFFDRIDASNGSAAWAARCALPRLSDPSAQLDAALCEAPLPSHLRAGPSFALLDIWH